MVRDMKPSENSPCGVCEYADDIQIYTIGIISVISKYSIPIRGQDHRNTVKMRGQNFRMLWFRYIFAVYSNFAFLRDAPLYRIFIKEFFAFTAWWWVKFTPFARYGQVCPYHTHRNTILICRFNILVEITVQSNYIIWWSYFFFSYNFLI